MKPFPAPGQSSLRSLFPNDLRDWHSPEALVRITLDVVSETDWRGAEHAAGLRALFLPAHAASVLTYAYLTGRYCSSEIEVAYDTDPRLRYLAGASRPGANLLRRFRRHHRGRLSDTLNSALQRCWSQHSATDPRPGTNLVNPGRLELWTFREAADRVFAGCHADSMDIDL